MRPVPEQLRGRISLGVVVTVVDSSDVNAAIPTIVVDIGLRALFLRPVRQR